MATHHGGAECPLGRGIDLDMEDPESTDINNESTHSLDNSSYIKIEKIRESFTNTPAYKAVHHDTPKFTSFHPFTDMEVCTVTMNMKNKHCELDIIQTSTLKQILDACLPAITQIVNLSLRKENSVMNGRPLLSNLYLKNLAWI